MKTYAQKPADVTRQWILIDAASNTLGRISTLAAKHLIGKHRPGYTPHVDSGDHVVIINAGKVKVGPRKTLQKIYWSHSGYPGSLKSATLAEALQKDPAFVVGHAVRGMLPKNKLAAGRLKRLHIYTGPEHSHQAQSPRKVGD